jgi:hypothetical protein
MSSFLKSLCDEQSLLALRDINRNTRPELWLPSRHVPSGMQASILGYGVLTAAGIPIITRLYAARIPSPKGRPTMVRKNSDGRWLAVAEKSAKVDYKGRFPAQSCKPGESFFKVISTIAKGAAVPIHVFNQWQPDEMTWTHNTEPVNGLVGILPINQGPCTEHQDRVALRIHQALYSSGFVVSPMYCEKFKNDMPPGFPEADETELLEHGPGSYLAALEQWAKDIANSIPTRNTMDLRTTLTAFASAARSEVEAIKAETAAGKFSSATRPAPPSQPAEPPAPADPVEAQEEEEIPSLEQALY